MKLKSARRPRRVSKSTATAGAKASSSSDHTGTSMYGDKDAYSVRTVPDEWLEAAAESGEPDPTPMTHRRALTVMPIREDADVLTGTLAALAMSVVCGAAWYSFESRDLIESPWLAVLMGILIAVAVRLGTGPHHSDVRATISLIFYILTLFTVAYFVESFDYVQIYGQRPNFEATQTELVRDRLTQPTTVLAWAIGLFANLQTGYLLRPRRTRSF